MRPLLVSCAGLIIGTVMGFSAAGAGSLGTIALLRFTNLAPASVVGTDVMAGLALSLAAGLAYLRAGAVSGPLLWKLALGGLPGAVAGVLFGSRLPAARLRTVILGWALALGLILLLQGLRQCLR